MSVSVIATVPVGTSPFKIAVNSATNRIYVANQISNTVSVIDGATKTVVATVPVGGNPNWVVLNQATNRIYVTNLQTATVTVIDGDDQ